MWHILSVNSFDSAPKLETEWMFHTRIWKAPQSLNVVLTMVDLAVPRGGVACVVQFICWCCWQLSHPFTFCSTSASSPPHITTTECFHSGGEGGAPGWPSCNSFSIRGLAIGGMTTLDPHNKHPSLALSSSSSSHIASKRPAVTILAIQSFKLGTIPGLCSPLCYLMCIDLRSCKYTHGENNSPLAGRFLLPAIAMVTSFNRASAVPLNSHKRVQSQIGFASNPYTGPHCYIWGLEPVCMSTFVKEPLASIPKVFHLSRFHHTSILPRYTFVGHVDRFLGQALPTYGPRPQHLLRSIRTWGLVWFAI